MRRTRVLLCPSAYYPSFGGVEEICRNMAAELVARGYEVAIAVNRWPAEATAREKLWNVDVFRFDFAFPARRHPLQTWRMLPSYLQFKKFVEQWKPDIIHVICPTAATFYLWLVRASFQCKILLTFQGELFMDNGNIFGRSAFARWALQKFLTVSDHITACSRYVLKDAEQRFQFPSAPTSILFNGVSLNEETGSKPRSRPYILGVGRLVRNKGFDLLIDAFAKVAGQFGGFDLVLAGDGDCRRELEQQAKALGLSDRVVFVGRQGRKEVTDLYSGCAFFVIPSPLEPFGIVCLEAMRAAKAVIAMDAGGPPEFIRNGEEGLLVNPSDVDQLADSLRLLLSDRAFSQRLGNNGRRAVEAFSWSKITAGYIKIYDQLLEHSIESRSSNAAGIGGSRPQGSGS